MRLPSPAELLAVWEHGQGQLPVQQALLLLAAAYPDQPPTALWQLPLGQRDAALLRLREQWFGSQLESVVRCVQCGQQLELKFAAADIQSEPAPMAELQAQAAEQTWRFRLPTSADLLAVASCTDPQQAQHQLVTRCLVDPPTEAILTLASLSTIAAQMAVADPQAEVQLALTCPNCGHRWSAVFDIVSYLWAELNSWAQHLLYDVHTLASAYGWREAEILALSPWRRQRYLQMVRGL